MRVCIVQPERNEISETFIHAHATRLPATVSVVYLGEGHLPMMDGRALLSQSIAGRVVRKAQRMLLARDWQWEVTAGYLAAFRQCRADVVLAEYGPTGVAVRKACEIAGIPLVVHFHGIDASSRQVLKEFADSYRQMFQTAAAVVAVSNAMRSRLLEIGADPKRTYLNVYGIACDTFCGASPLDAPPTFLAVGRFVEKKAPYLTILAFAETLRRIPEAKLRMIGDGPLIGPCRDLAAALGMAHAVQFLGAQPGDVVAMEMKQARAFVQHSIEASDGDCEGTPLAILEAGASGLPVVSTRHAGIADVVVDGQTGFIVEEKDVVGMADGMVRIATDASSAARLGAAARDRITTLFTIEKSIDGLHSILRKAVEGSCSGDRIDSATQVLAPLSAVNR